MIPSFVRALLAYAGRQKRLAAGTHFHFNTNATEPAWLLRRSIWPPTGILLLLLLAIDITGYGYYVDQKAIALQAARDQLQAIAELKAQAIGRWLKERKGDAITLFNDHLDIGLLPFFATPADSDLREETRIWLDSLKRYYSYSAIVLVDMDGQPLVAVPATDSPLDAQAQSLIQEAISTEKVVFSTLYFGPVSVAPHLDFIVPLIAPDEPRRRSLGALFLRIDADDFLYPTLNAWPIPAAVSAETLLVRRDHNYVVFLNRVEQSAGHPRFLRLPLDTPGLPAALALQTPPGVFNGVDYRGVEVVAAVHPVAESSWSLVAKIDQQEINAPILADALKTGAIVVLLMLLATLSTWLMWRRQAEIVLRGVNRWLTQRVHERTAALTAEAKERRQAENRLRLWSRAVAASNNGIFIIDAAQPHTPLVHVNPAFERITGYSEAEVLGCSYPFPPTADHVIGLNDLERALREHHEAHVLLRCYRKDGGLFWNDVFLAPVYDSTNAVSHFIGVITDVSERQAYEEQLEHQATHDNLTQLPNRILLQDRLDQALMRAQRSGHKVAVIFVNLDRFKRVNDSLGHDAGDELLRAVAERLKSSLRARDTLARLGGDEFVIVVEEIPNPEQADAVGRKILAEMTLPFTITEQHLVVTCSLGISLFPRDGDNPQTLLKNANTAMHRVKERGRNASLFYVPKMNGRTLDHLTLEHELRQALTNNELHLHYQPQIDANFGVVTGVEALIRWQHPTRGAISPASFIPLAEESELINTLGTWVLNTACTQVKAWQVNGHASLRLGVNLSPRQFAQGDLIQHIDQILNDTGLGPPCLELEITENLLMQDIDRTIPLLHALKDLGLRLAIDDFGTGYSSLNYLKRFPLDRLKIDQSFVRDITTHLDDAAITEAIIGLAHNLRLGVIAEGVETAAQLAFLKQKRCDEMQGYYFSRPLPPEQLGAVLAGESVNIFGGNDPAGPGQ